MNELTSGHYLIIYVLSALMFFHVVAAANNNVIGKAGKLPWKIQADLEWFRQLTWGHAVIMGRKTFEGLGRTPLEGRKNYIVSHYGMTLREALTETQDEEKVFIIGGQTLYEQTLDIVKGIWMTRIEADFDGDTFYPDVPKDMKMKVEKTSTATNNAGQPEMVRISMRYYEREFVL